MSVILVPENSDKLAIFDPKTRTLDSVDVPGFSTGFTKFSGACSVEGQVVLVPWYSNKLAIFDPKTRTLDSVDVTGVATGDYKFKGACSVEGQVVLAPYYSKKLVIFDTKTRTLDSVDVTGVPGGRGKFCGACSVEGKVVLAPGNSDKLVIFDPKTKALDAVDVTGVTNENGKFEGACSVEGKVVLAPFNSDKLVIFDPKTKALDSVDVTGVAPGRGRFIAACSVEGKVVLAPGMSDKLVIFDPKTKALDSVDVTGVAPGIVKFLGACSVGGKVVLAPGNLDKLVIFDPRTKDLESVDLIGITPGGWKFVGAWCLEGESVAAVGAASAGGVLASSAASPHTSSLASPVGDIRIRPYAKWSEITPSRPLLQELRENSRIRSKAPLIDEVAMNVESKCNDLTRFDPAGREQVARQGQDDNELQALLAYTHDLELPDDVKAGNLYYECNNDLRATEVEQRRDMMNTWGVYMHYALRGMYKLDKYEGHVMRGLPNRELIMREYLQGREVQWKAFTSTTTSEANAKSFSDRDSGIIAKLVVLSGRKFGNFTFYEDECEILLAPNTKFFVALAPYLAEDGWWYVDLAERALGDPFTF